MQRTDQLSAPSSRQDLALAEPLVSHAITEANYQSVLQSWKSNATYSNLETYALYLRAFRPSNLAEREFTKEAALFLMPYLASRQAFADAESSKKLNHHPPPSSSSLNENDQFIRRLLRTYSPKHKDCFTYQCSILNRIKRHEPEKGEFVWDIARGNVYSNQNSIPHCDAVSLPSFREDFDLYMSQQTYSFRDLAQGIQLQVGDWVKVNHSSTGHNHWAKVVEVNGELMLVSRRRHSVDIESLADFTAYMREDKLSKKGKKKKHHKPDSPLEVRRLYGFSGYGQHFEVKMLEPPVTAPKPHQIGTFKISLEIGPEPEPVVPVRMTQNPKKE